MDLVAMWQGYCTGIRAIGSEVRRAFLGMTELDCRVLDDRPCALIITDDSMFVVDLEDGSWYEEGRNRRGHKWTQLLRLLGTSCTQ